MPSDLPFPRYQRRGECSQCGWCCLQEDPPCPHLHLRDDGKYDCLIHDDEDRPSHCKIYPGNPPVKEFCGYYFWDRWNKVKVKDKLTR